jgi:hypothetical protein
MKTIRINRAKWLRGSNKEKVNYLWCSQRQAGCCLGHAIHQTAKCAWKDLRGLTTPLFYYSKPSFLTEIGPDGFTSNDLAEQAMSINDSNDISEEQREKRLIELFAENNIKLEFYN